MPERTGGIVLAGGRSRRMGGVDKALMPVGGIASILRVLDALRPQCDVVVVSHGDADPARFAGLGLPTVADAVPGGHGPLAGILAGLDWFAAREPTIGQAVSVATDMPFLPDDLVARLRQAAAGAGTGLACAASNGRRHPVCALWPVGLRDDLRRALVGGRVRRVGAFMEAQGCVGTEWPTLPFDPFFNVNTAEDLARAEALARTKG